MSWRPAWCCPVLPRTASYCQVLPGTAPYCPVLPGTARCCLVLPRRPDALQDCCLELVRASTARWQTYGHGSDPYVDDITLVVVFGFPELQEEGPQPAP